MASTAATSSVKTARIEASIDMISDLPKDVIHKIMLFLPIVDAAKMSVLSKAWRNNWVSIPQLVFDSGFIDLLKGDAEWDDGVETYKWSSVISNVLLLHKGSIIEFSLTIPNIQSELWSNIIPWISYVSENGVKMFALLNENWNYPIKLPYYLFSRVLLECLTLEGCAISHYPCFTGLGNLSCLVLTDVYFARGATTKFFACCPLLQKLKLTRCGFANSELHINMPNLNKLSIKSPFMLPCISFKNASSLLSFSLILSEYDGFEGAIDMIKFLADSCELQKLCIGGENSEVLASTGILRILPTTLTQLKILELHRIKLYHKDVFSFVFGLIRSCLNMETLIITVDGPSSHDPVQVKMLENSENEEWALGHFDNDCAFNHLRAIHVRKIRGLSIELKLISYLLACSPSLKRLSFTCHYTLPSLIKQEVRRKLLKFGKASPKAKVVLVNSK